VRVAVIRLDRMEGGGGGDRRITRDLVPLPLPLFGSIVRASVMDEDEDVPCVRLRPMLGAYPDIIPELCSRERGEYQ